MGTAKNKEQAVLGSKILPARALFFTPQRHSLLSVAILMWLVLGPDHSQAATPEPPAESVSIAIPPNPAVPVFETETNPPAPTIPPPLSPRVKALREARKATLKSASGSITSNNATFSITALDPSDPRLFTPAFKQNLMQMGLDENQIRIFAWKTRTTGRGVEPLNSAEREQRRDAIQDRLQSIIEQYEAKEARGTLSAQEAQQHRRLREIAKLFDKNKDKYRENDLLIKEREKEKSLKKPQEGGGATSPDARPGRNR